MPTPKPLLFLDVDDVLAVAEALTKNGFLPPKVTGKDERYEWELHHAYPSGFRTKGVKLVITKNHGVELRKLQKHFTIIWATTWNEEANEWISPLLGLPSLPVLVLPEDGNETNWAKRIHHRGSWKTYWIARWLDEYGWYKDDDGERKRLPWAFVDNEANRYDYAWVQGYWQEAARTPVAPRLILHVEKKFGLRTRDFNRLRTWAESL